MTRLDPREEARLADVARALVDQQQARVLVPPRRSDPGYWFGGGNLVEDDAGRLYLAGRYRNQGDSRTGLGAGERGLELAIFRSDDRGQSFEQVVRLSKADLQEAGREVLSIEGSALRWTADGVELFVSCEQTGIGYPDGFQQFLKPGAGVWVIQRLAADSIESLAGAPAATILAGRDPCWLHVKDPVGYDTPAGDTVLMFCTHPFSWSSSNTAYAVRPAGSAAFDEPRFECFPRGAAWDVAITRGTAIVDLPLSPLAGGRHVGLVFYDGGESLRNLDEHARAVRRPRGYSCEELGGAAYFLDGNLDRLVRLSPYLPLLVSPHGTGCSRYVDVLRSRDGWLTTWQQSQPDQSQPLVMHRLAEQRLLALLGA